MSIIPFTNSDLNAKIQTIHQNDQVYFKAKDVAITLGYIDTKQAVRNNIDADDKLTLHELLELVVMKTPLSFHDKKAIWINESGLYSLIMGSKKEEAKVFKKWVTSEVLPSIRKTGAYVANQITYPQIQLLNEKDLHYKVVHFIRRFYPDALLSVSMGELQDTSKKRCDAYNKGFKGGAPDILILNTHKTYAGIAIEMKSPTGKGRLSDNQKTYLQQLELNNWKCLVSNDYDEILVELINYFKNVRTICKFCKRKFCSSETLDSHQRKFHKIC